MNMQTIGRKISTLRKERDLTQVDLADKLGVTYQAVSSWERGNSMPDIAKLPEISQVLQISIDELLGDDKVSKLVANVLTGEENFIPDLQTIADAAPILKPSQIEDIARKQSIQVTVEKNGETTFSAKATSNAQGQFNPEDLQAIVNMAPHLSSSIIKDIILKHTNVDEKIVSQLASYLDEEDLKDIALHARADDLMLKHIASYLDSDALLEIVMRCDAISSSTLRSIACYMDSDALVSAVCKCNPIDAKTFASIAPHMDSEGLREVLLQQQLDSGTIANIACHMDSEDLRTVLLNQDFDAGIIANIACHMDSEDLRAVLLSQKFDAGLIANIACHMNSEDLRDIAKKLIQDHGLSALSASGIIAHMDEDDIAAAIKSVL